MKIRLFAIIFLLFFAFTESKKFMKKKEEDLKLENLQAQVTLKVGDIVVKKEDNALSDFLSSFEEKKFSNIGLVVPTTAGLKVLHLDIEDENLQFSSMKDYSNFAVKLAVFEYEEKVDENTLVNIVKSLQEKDIKFDYDYEFDNEKFYSTELINKIYFELFGENLYTNLGTFLDKEIILISDILKNSRLKKRFELDFKL